MKTYKFRLKNTNINQLKKMAGAVNFVWNFCNDTSIQYLDKKGKWLSGFDLDYLTKGCTKELPINSDTVQSVDHEFATRRRQFKKRRWKSTTENNTNMNATWSRRNLRMKDDNEFDRFLLCGPKQNNSSKEKLVEKIKAMKDVNEPLNQIDKDAEETVKDIDYQYEHFFIKGFKAGAISQNNKLLKAIIDQIEAYPMYPEEKKSWLTYLENLKITDK